MLWASFGWSSTVVTHHRTKRLVFIINVLRVSVLVRLDRHDLLRKRELQLLIFRLWRFYIVDLDALHFPNCFGCLAVSVKMRQIFIAKAERFWHSDCLKGLHGAPQTLLAEPWVARGLLEELRSLLLMVLHADQVRALAWVFFFDCRQMLSVWGTDDLLYRAHFRRVITVPCQLLKVRPLIILRIGKLDHFLVVWLVWWAERVLWLVFMLRIGQDLLIRSGVRLNCRVLENNSPAVLLMVR